jgi:hypothetical protein
VDTSIISALAALTGAAVGGLTSGIANWLNHRCQVRAQWLHHEKNRRQILYRDFIEEASKCYIDAQHAEAAFPVWSVFTPKLSSIRALSSKPVVLCAEDVARKSWTPIWSRTRASSNSPKWPSTARSICCKASATCATTNSRRCGQDYLDKTILSVTRAVLLCIANRNLI